MKKNAFMKKSITLFLCLLFTVISGMVACADVIWEPDDNFYTNHYKDCVSMNRSFTANGASGNITVWENPNSDRQVASVINGSTFVVSFTYTDSDGVVWGVVQFQYDENGIVKPAYSGNYKTGWIPMKDLVVIYDNISFREEHKNEFKTYNGELDDNVLKDGIVFWTYPGSGVTAGTIKIVDKKNLTITDTYTDKDGVLWGYTPYYMGIKNEWICLRVPEDKTITTVTTSVSTATKDTTISTETVTTAAPIATEDTTISAITDETAAIIAPVEPSKNVTVTVLLIVLVAAVIAVTAILIPVLYKKQKD